MKKKIYLFLYILLLVNCIYASNSIPTFETDRVKETYNLLPNEIKFIINNTQYKDTLINGNIIIPNSKLNILFNKDKEISHIGFYVNKSKIKYDFFEAYLFIENYLLNLTIDTSTYYLTEFAKIHNIKIMYNKVIETNDFKKNKLLVSEILFNRINLNYKNSVFQSVWNTNNNHSLTMNFPANINLVKGMDKSDLEKDFIRKLKTYTNVKNYTPINMNKILPAHDGLYIIKGKEFETDNFRADIYFQKNEFNKYFPVFTIQNPIESFSNLFISDIENSFKIENTFILYGNKKQTVTYSFKQLHSYLSDNNQIFFGLNSFKNNYLHATIIYYNPIYNYIHMLLAEIDKQNLFSEKNIFIKTSLYMYIPRVDLIKTIKKTK